MMYKFELYASLFKNIEAGTRDLLQNKAVYQGSSPLMQTTVSVWCRTFPLPGYAYSLIFVYDQKQCRRNLTEMLNAPVTFGQKFAKSTDICIFNLVNMYAVSTLLKPLACKGFRNHIHVQCNSRRPFRVWQKLGRYQDIAFISLQNYNCPALWVFMHL